MVKLASTLPKEHDDNGIEGNTRHLLTAYPKQDYLPVVGLVRTKDVLSDENFVKVPRIEFVHIELAVDPADQDTVRDLIRGLHDARVAHVKQPLDLPDVDPPATAPAAPLELAAGATSDNVVDAELVDDEPRALEAPVVDDEEVSA